MSQGHGSALGRDAATALIERRAANGRAHVVGLSLGGEMTYLLLAHGAARLANRAGCDQ